MAKYSIEGKPYATRVLAQTTCSKCGKPIRKNGRAYGVRRGKSFFYYHINHKPKS